jgi:TrmH family RNA methyltransferase
MAGFCFVRRINSKYTQAGLQQTRERMKIDDRNDPRIARIRRLFRRDERDKCGLILADGVRFAAQAISSGAQIEMVLVAPKVLTSRFGRQLADTAARAGANRLDVPPEMYYSLSPSQEPQGILLVIRRKCERLPQGLPPRSLWVALEEVRSAGNFGTIVRSCEAAGATGLLICGDRIDPFDPASVRATMGALFFQRIVRTSLEELELWKRKHGCLVVGTSPAAPCDFRSLCYAGPTVLLMGGERRGLSERQKGLCDVIVRIPMAGKSDSLNLATATGIMLYEAYRQRNPVDRYGS